LNGLKNISLVIMHCLIGKIRLILHKKEIEITDEIIKQFNFATESSE